MDGEERKPQILRAKVRWSDRPRLSPDAASRQGRVTRLAIETFGDPRTAIEYLNQDCGKLGGRPLDLAVESPEGLGRVERALTELKSVC
jgi:uncharacterized protein (DUF2384 family)